MTAVRRALRLEDAQPADRELIEVYLVAAAAEGLAPRTVESRRRVLIRASEQVGELLALTPDRLAAWLARPGWSAETRSSYFKHLHVFLRWCVDTGRLAVDPLAKMRPPRVPAHLPRPAPLAVYRAILADGTEPWLTVVLLAAHAGLRIGEICRLRREDITAENILVEGKGGKTALVPTHRRIWCHVKDRPPGLLVRENSGQVRRSVYLADRFAMYLRRLGLPKVTVHQFRHLYATELLRQTGNLRVVQQLMRHSNVHTTTVYTAVVDADRQAAIGALDLDGPGQPRPGRLPAVLSMLVDALAALVNVLRGTR